MATRSGLLGDGTMTMRCITYRVVLLAFLAGTLGCRNEVQPPTFPAPLPAAEVTKKAPKPQPIDPKKDMKSKRPRPRVSDGSQSTN